MIQSEIFHLLKFLQNKKCTGKQDDNNITYASTLQFYFNSQMHVMVQKRWVVRCLS